MKKVVSATLAGALAVGMVPAMALADDAVELQTADVESDVALGKITAAVDEDGNKIDLSEEIVFTLSDDADDPLYLVPAEVTTYTGASYDVAAAVAKGEAYVRYYKVTENGIDTFSWLEDGDEVEGRQSASTISWTAGEYYAVVCVGHDANIAGYGAAIKFTIEADSLKDAYLFEVNADATDGGVSDTEFVYTAGNLDLDLTFGKKGDLVEGTDYDLVFYKKNPAGKYAAVSNVVDAGSYKAVVVGDDEYAGYNGEIKFDVEVLNLGEATIVVNPAEAYKVVQNPLEAAEEIDMDDIVAINGVKGAALPALADQIDMAYDGDTIGVTKLKKGEYTYTLTVPQVQDDVTKDFFANTNVTGTAKVSVVRYAEEATFFYGDTEITGADYTVAKKYSEANIAVAESDAEDADAVAYTVTYNKKNTKNEYVPVSSYSAPGEYQAVVTVNSKAEGYDFGGQKIINFEVEATTLVAEDSVFVTYGGKLLTGDIKADYSGADVLDAVAVTVVDAKGKALTEGVDYVVSVVNDKDPKVQVEEVVNAGDYTLTVLPAEGSKYAFSGDYTVAIEVAPAEVLPEIIDQLAPGVALYTGKDIDPIVGWTTKDSPLDKDTDREPITLAEGSYKIVITGYEDEDGKPATALTMPEAINAAGEYTIEIIPAKTATNYDFSGLANEYTIYVEDGNLFIDVPSDAWYADAVIDIVNEGIMGGYANKKFGPMDNAERQDLAVMIMRMLEPSTKLTVINNKDYAELVSLITGMAGDLVLPFSDAKGDAYYSLGVWYCNKNGIMTGYSDSDEFGVGDAVTREQVAATLFRINEAGFFAEEGTLLASALDAYADADEISNYAVEAMEWAVENGIFGVNTKFLNPGDEITRAELAAVFVRFLEMNEAAGKGLVA